MNYIEKEYRSVITRIGISLLFFLLVFNLFSGGAELFSMLMREFDSGSDAVYIATDLISSVAYLASFILPVPFFYIISQNAKKHPMNLTLSLPSPHSTFKLGAIVWAGIAIIVPMAYLNSLIFPVSVDTTSELFGFDFSEPYKLVLSFISTALVPAFAEELLFRGLVVSNIKPYSKSAAVIISAVAFGFMHQNPAQILYATAAGIVFGIVYVETDSIWCCITLHFVNNFISIMQSYFFYILEEESANVLLFFFDIFLVLGGMICAVVILGSLKKKRVKNNLGVYGVYDNATSGSYANVNFVKNGFATPTLIIFLALCAIQCVINGVLINVM